RGLAQLEPALPLLNAPSAGTVAAGRWSRSGGARDNLGRRGRGRRLPAPAPPTKRRRSSTSRPHSSASPDEARLARRLSTYQPLLTSPGQAGDCAGLVWSWM